MASAKKGQNAGESSAKRKKPKPAIAPELEAELLQVVQANPPPEPAASFAKPSPRRYTLKEVREQVRDVEELLIEGARAPVIWRVLAQGPNSKHPTLTRARVSKLVERVQNDWTSIAKDDDRLAKREAAIRRLHRMRQIASGTRAADGKSWLVPPNHSAVRGYEDLLVKLEGTAEAIQVDVDVRYTAAMLEVVGSLTGEMAAEYLQEALQQRELADVARRELPALVVEARAKLQGEGQAASHEAE